ncbi:MAG: succinyl-CoA--3-ketoacid-CoA transferase [Deltaproteobacteria bacterium HGW-Deltaproteobacteria-14]|jgi:3-oxoacid CoA-transferase subunit A|nr:MAG: succinyl-CoA--3-ketoacid-CoA transferase [Deltaproteobacteria bacterium HGW-Deltaproteobacteria-14]
MTTKIVPDAAHAIADLRDGASVMVGGFGLSGNPEHLIDALAASGRRGLTIISNNCGNQGQGLAVLLQNRQVAAWKGSFMGGNPDIQEQYAAGVVTVELIPQGTLAERIRAGGAGIPAFFTPTGAGTIVAEGKEERVIGGRRVILEEAITADWAFIRAHRGDAYGNLQFRGTTRNFQLAMAMAGLVTVAEVDELVPVGAIAPDDVHLPGVFVQRVFEARTHRDPIEHRTTRPRPT